MILLLLSCTSAEPYTGEPRGPLAFGFPLPDRELFSEVIGVDHDPVVQEGLLGAAVCTAYDGAHFPTCYDEHTGTDYMLVGGFQTMDAGSTQVVAAAAGVVVEAVDGNYDRCHADADAEDGVSCDGHEQASNHVIVQHAEGFRSLYWHLKQGSVAVEVGQWVSCGTHVGLVGSSGRSSAPHLHFGVEDLDGRTVDPYAGDFSQPETFWLGQGARGDLPDDGCAEGA